MINLVPYLHIKSGLKMIFEEDNKAVKRDEKILTCLICSGNLCSHKLSVINVN